MTIPLEQTSKSSIGQTDRMANEALEALLTEQFEVAVGPALQTDLLRKRLGRTEHVQRLRKALDQGEVTDDEVGDFVSKLTGQFRSGHRLPHEMALAGIAVALEHRGTTFTDEYLRTLAGLRLAELGSAPRVAEACLVSRKDRPQTEWREIVMEVPQERIEVRSAAEVPLSQRPMSVELTFGG